MSLFKASEKAQTSGGKFPSLEPGTYDAVLHGIIELGVHTKRGFKGASDRDVPMLNFLFEIPSVTNDDGVTKIVSKKLPYSLHEKSGMSKIIKALIHSTDQDKVVDTVHAEEGIQALLGKPVSITVDDWTPPESAYPVSVVREITPLDPRLPEQPVAVREPVLFAISAKDAVEVFTEKLTPYTRKTIMEASNASSFPVALHEAYKSTLEDESQAVDDVLG